MSSSKIVSDCIEKKIIPIEGKVDGDMFHFIREIMGGLLLKDCPDILVTFTSTGGSVSAGLDIYDLINNYPGKSTGIVFAMANSIAAVILQACDERICAKHAEILIHYISQNSISLDVMSKPNGKAYQNMLKGGRRDQAYINQILTERTGQALKVIRGESAKDLAMTSEEALIFGLIDRIAEKKDLAKWFSSGRGIK